MKQHRLRILVHTEQFHFKFKIVSKQLTVSNQQIGISAKRQNRKQIRSFTDALDIIFNLPTNHLSNHPYNCPSTSAMNDKLSDLTNWAKL